MDKSNLTPTQIRQRKYYQTRKASDSEWVAQRNIVSKAHYHENKEAINEGRRERAISEKLTRYINVKVAHFIGYRWIDATRFAIVSYHTPNKWWLESVVIGVDVIPKTERDILSRYIIISGEVDDFVDTNLSKIDLDGLVE